MPRGLPTLQRRVFLIGTTSTVAAILLDELIEPARLFSQTCTQTVPKLSSAPYTYIQEPKLLALRADCLLQQLSKGYGYYGQPRNWTTLWSLTAMSRTLNNILNNELRVANSLASLVCDADRLISDISSYDTAIATAQQIQDSTLKDIKADNDAAVALLSVIRDLASDIASQRSIVDSTQSRFNTAVMNAASGGCGIGQVLGIVAAVIAVAGAAFTAGTSLVAAYGAVGTLVTTGMSSGAATATALQQLKSAYNSLKPIVTKIETAANDVKDIQTKYTALHNELTADSDSARVVVEKSYFDSLSATRLDNFDKTVNGAAGVSQEIKDELIQAVHKYYDLVQLRNQKINDHDSLILSIQNSARSYYEQALQIANLSDMKSRLASSRQIPEKIAYTTSLNRIQNAQLTAMRQLVWDEKRAEAFSELNLELLSDTELVHIDSTNTATDLLQAHNGILTQHSQYIASQQPVVTSFDASGVDVKLTLSSADRRSFASTRRLRFTVSPGDGRFPSHMKEIFVTGFKITMQPKSPLFSGRLVHFGRHLFETVSGNRVEFSSEPTYIGIQSGESPNFIDIVGTGTTEQIHGLSAFGDWAVIADASVSNALLGGLTSITITFAGNSRASTQ